MNATMEQRRSVARMLSRHGWLARYRWYNQLSFSHAEKILESTEEEIERLARTHHWKAVEPTAADEERDEDEFAYKALAKLFG